MTRGLGDRDTTCAIAGGILAAGDQGRPIPGAWRSARESLETFRAIGLEEG